MITHLVWELHTEIEKHHMLCCINQYMCVNSLIWYAVKLGM